MKKRMTVWVLTALLLCAALMPGCALAQAQASAAAKTACSAAGGQVLETARTVKVVSPYGTQSVVLRSEPSDSYDAIAMLMVGQEITVVGTHGAFVFVQLEDGSVGWLADDEVK